jgi:SAM-dependent methyltransferase
MLLRATERIHGPESTGIHFARMSAGCLAFPDSTFDLVLCVTVLMHVTRMEAWRKAIQEIVRVTRVGGLIALHEFAPDNSDIRLGPEVSTHLVDEYLLEFNNAGANCRLEIGVDNPATTLLMTVGERLLLRGPKGKNDAYFYEVNDHPSTVLSGIAGVALVPVCRALDHVALSQMRGNNRSSTKLFVFERRS